MINTAVFLVKPDTTVAPFAKALKQHQFKSFVAVPPTARVLEQSSVSAHFLTGYIAPRLEENIDPKKIFPIVKVLWGIESMHPRPRRLKPGSIIASAHELTASDKRQGAPNIQLVVLDLSNYSSPDHLMIAAHAMEHGRWVLTRRKDWERLLLWLKEKRPLEEITGELTYVAGEFYRDHWHKISSEGRQQARLSWNNK